MSLSLAGLKNSKGGRRAQDSQVASSTAETGTKSQKAKPGSQTARPWAGSVQAPRNSRSRRRVSTDATMNDEWVSLHDEPLFWVDLQSNSRLACMHDRLAAFEEQVSEMITGPLKAIQGLFRPPKN